MTTCIIWLFQNETCVALCHSAECLLFTNTVINGVQWSIYCVQFGPLYRKSLDSPLGGSTQSCPLAYRKTLKRSPWTCFLFRTLGWASFRDVLLFEMGFFSRCASFQDGLLLEIKPTGLLFKVLLYIKVPARWTVPIELSNIKTNSNEVMWF